MKKLHLNAWSTFGVALLLACSSSKPDGLGENNPSQAQGAGSTGSANANAGGAGSGKITGISTAPSDAGSGSSVSGTDSNGGAAASGNGTGGPGDGTAGAGSNGSNGTGSTPNSNAGGVGGTGVESTDGGAGTLDPPKATGGTGITLDPPVGDTEDPPVGDTTDPPVGDTGDPPVGDTGDPPVGDTGDPPVGDTGDPPVGDTPDPPAECTMTEIDEINVIVFGDAAPGGADVEGKMWVGGDADFSGGGYGVGQHDSAAAATKCTEYSLVVGGSLSGTINSGNGNIAYGKSSTASTSPCEIFHATPVDFEAIEAKLKGYSAFFRDYEPPAANQGVVSTGGGGLTLTGTDKELNIFSLTAQELTSASEIKINVPLDSSVVVNVSGLTVNWGGAGFNLPGGLCRGGSGDMCHRILWNFYEATSISLSGIGVQGSVLAPYAAVTGAGGNVDGQLVAESLTGGIEYHPYFFSGCLVVPKV